VPLSTIKRYDFIDALRGIAILGVILVHASRTIVPSNPTLRWLMLEGASGVQLFFVVSALTLCMSWTARSPHENFPLQNFYIRRFFRVAPMFYVAILLYILIKGFAPDYWSPNGIAWWFIPVTAAFLHGFHPETINSLVPGGWSIAVEMSFYLILPLLLKHIKSIKACLIALLISFGLYAITPLIVPQIFIYPANQHYLLKGFNLFNFPSQLPVLIMGMLCYLIIREKYPKKPIAIVGGTLFAALLLEFTYAFLKLPHHLVGGGLLAIFVLLLAHWPIRLFVNKLTTSIGKISYSMFLTHFALLALFYRSGFNDLFPNSNAASFLYYLCLVLSAAGVSWFCHKYIEKAGIAWGARLIEKREQAHKAQ
jgi:peptidoglycan/LPS O-acetylase OafA/YrhL